MASEPSLTGVRVSRIDPATPEIAANRKAVAAKYRAAIAASSLARATAKLSKRRRSSTQAAPFAPGSPEAIAAYLAAIERVPFGPEARERRDIERYLEANGLSPTAVAGAMMLRDAWLAGDSTAHEP